MADVSPNTARKTASPPPQMPKPQGSKPDFATIGGIAVALAGIVGGLLLEKGSLQDVAQVTAAMIVIGGTLGAVLVTTPFPVFLRACKGLGGAFLEDRSSTGGIIESLIRYAALARKNGIVSLEPETASIVDPFFRKALNLAVDGTDLQEICKMMELDISLSEMTGNAEAKVWEAAGGYAPTIGIIGAVMGLIQVMKDLEDIRAVGHGIAVAFVATVYGVASANLFFLPVANKLRGRVRSAALVKDLILEGVVGLVEGMNPTLLRMKLEAYNQEPAKPAKVRTVKPGSSPAPSGHPAPGEG
jgi:chemotaxis protein MotA